MKPLVVHSKRLETDMTFKKPLLSILVVSSLAGTFVSSHSSLAQSAGLRENGYHCNGSQAAFYQPLNDWIAGRTTHFTQQLYVLRRVAQWDARYIREGCERLAKGETWDDSCLNGRRNLEEIAETLPDNLTDLSFQEVNALAAQIQHKQEYRAAFQFCRDNNVYK